ncbi:MAG: ribosome-associated translation inhibitor RaiA [Gammaproteobacteria bacterium]|nr:ribosome-associated translation inhibitor RaiA [Gammaproteobacteria bacterium]
MQINLAGQHVDITPALKNYVEEKLQRLERHFDHVVDTHVVLIVEKQSCKAEATVHVSGGNLHAESLHDDMYAAIDGLIDKLDRQVIKHKEKRADHHAREANNARGAQ